MILGGSRESQRNLAQKGPTAGFQISRFFSQWKTSILASRFEPTFDHGKNDAIIRHRVHTTFSKGSRLI